MRTGAQRSGLLTTWDEVSHEVDVEIRQLVRESILNAIRDGTEEQRKPGTVEDCHRGCRWTLNSEIRDDVGVDTHLQGWGHSPE